MGGSFFARADDYLHGGPDEAVEGEQAAAAVAVCVGLGVH